MATALLLVVTGFRDGTPAFPQRAFRTAVAMAVALVLIAFFVVPMVLDSSYINHSRWEPAWKWDSFGAEAIGRALANGTLLDDGRLPILTLLAAAGYSGATFDPARVRIWIAGQPVFEYGVRAASFDEAAAHQAMMQPEYTIAIDLGAGKSDCLFLTCDLTVEYVRINADYST